MKKNTSSILRGRFIKVQPSKAFSSEKFGDHPRENSNTVLSGGNIYPFVQKRVGTRA